MKECLKLMAIIGLNGMNTKWKFNSDPFNKINGIFLGVLIIDI